MRQHKQAGSHPTGDGLLPVCIGMPYGVAKIRFRLDQGMFRASVKFL